MNHLIQSVQKTSVFSLFSPGQTSTTFGSCDAKKLIESQFQNASIDEIAHFNFKVVTSKEVFCFGARDIKDIIKKLGFQIEEIENDNLISFRIYNPVI